MNSECLLTIHFFPFNLENHSFIADFKTYSLIRCLYIYNLSNHQKAIDIYEALFNFCLFLGRRFILITRASFLCFEQFRVIFKLSRFVDFHKKAFFDSVCIFRGMLPLIILFSADFCCLSFLFSFNKRISFESGQNYRLLFFLEK